MLPISVAALVATGTADYLAGGFVNAADGLPTAAILRLLILSTGGYRFADFLRVGIPLIVILWIGFSIVPPLMCGL